MSINTVVVRLYVLKQTYVRVSHKGLDGL